MIALLSRLGVGGVLARLVFAVAAASAACASTGVAAPPHQVAPGTPLVHTLVLGAYRYGFLMEPLREPTGMSAEMAALHKALAMAGMPMPLMSGMPAGAPADAEVPVFDTAGLHPMHDLAITLALLVAFVPRLPRPTRRIGVRLPLIRLCAPQWRAQLLLAPPRSVAFAA